MCNEQVLCSLSLLNNLGFETKSIFQLESEERGHGIPVITGKKVLCKLVVKSHTNKMT